MDAGARGRRLLQRREYKAKVSDFVPKELEDHVVYENEILKKVGSKLKAGFGKLFKGDIIAPTINKQQHQDAIRNKGKTKDKDGNLIDLNMGEASSAQEKAMHDAKMKKMEDDKVAQKKKKVDEACWKGYEKKGMKTMFGKRYPNCVKKTKKEEVELEAKKSCGEGEYYCYDEQKCKPIPDGMKVGKDGMLVKEDMKGMSQKSGDKRSTESGAGMTAKGVAKYNRRTGGNLKTAVTTPPSKLKAGSKAAKRRKSFCARSKSWTGPRGKAARRRWNCEYEPELPMIDEKKKLYNTSPLSDRVSNWSKKINEGSLVRGDYGPYVSGQSTKKEKKEKIDPKKLPVAERKMTSAEKDKKEKYVKGMKKDKGGFTKRYGKDGKSVMYATATKMAMKKEEAFDEAKYEKGASDYGKTSIRNKRAFGKGGNAAPPKERGAAKMLRHDAHQKRRFVKKNNKYGATNKPPVYGAPSDEFKKNKNVKEQQIPQVTGLGGGGGGTNAITDKAKTKTIGNYAKDALKIASIPARFMLNIKSPQDPLSKFAAPTTAAGKVDSALADYKRKLNMGEGSLSNLPGLGGGGGGTDSIMATSRSKSLGKRIGDVAKIATTPARFMLNIKSPVDPTTKFASPTTPADKVDSALANYKRKLNMGEGSLHKWFKGSKSKDGKGGWVNVVTGGTCASDKPGEGTPKCVSSSKRASMSKAERLSASRRKKKADPGQQSKSGAAKPTYVATDSKKKK